MSSGLVCLHFANPIHMNDGGSEMLSKWLLSSLVLFIIINNVGASERSDSYYIPDNILSAGIFTFFLITLFALTFLRIAFENKNNRKVFISGSILSTMFFILDIALIIFLSTQHIMFIALFIPLLIGVILFFIIN